MKIQNAFRLGLFGGIGVLVAVVIGTGLSTLATILTYVGAALFLALGVDPAVSFLERRKIPRSGAILIVLAVILGVFAGFIFAVIPVIADQVGTLIQQVPNLIDTLTNQAAIKEWWQTTLPWLDYSEVVKNVQNWFTDNIETITTGVFATVITVASGVFGGLIVLILTLYFVASLGSIKRALYQLIPASKREKFIDISEQISTSVGRYVIGQGTLGAINGVQTLLFMTVLGWILGTPIEYTALLAFIAFLFSLVPLVGTVTGSVIITAAVWLFNGSPAVIIVGIWYLVYMQLEAYLLSPNIMNRAVKVPGVVVVIAALAGGTLLGILGALVAIPVAASILLIIKQVVIPRQNEL
ncbi:AI-2E family transporter [Homoserinibacter sp. GY 40078]|uniref:AI-2E family transporter n=1 Tax=Homoserinibacter sp. GY 40078 TaxID=2603275 RepID=UPI0011C7B1AB|nr:AI-2E family transporter [Homoserinibacter sp. GY 40078]TXK17059.1 AI-2E family transporter [Homoserinibacter sp. GY 40078]